MKKISNSYKAGKKRILGLMSGTSLDGLDLADTSFQSKDKITKITFHSYQFFPYSKKQRSQILQAMQGGARELCQIHYELGAFFAKCVLKYFKQKHLNPANFSLIASHGQTFYHYKNIGSLQLGEADILAHQTQIPVVFDFRPADIARGGEGAPLMPYFDQYLQTQLKFSALFLNLGGIANFSVLSKKKMIFSDTGPANILLNLALLKYSNGRVSYDKDGKIAKKGKLIPLLLKELLKHPFLKKSIPKTTGHETFGIDFLVHIFKKYPQISIEDLLKTLTVFSVKTIADSCKKYLPYQDSTVLASGGGVKNPVLMQLLKEHFAPYKVANFTDFFPFGADAKEAVAFAYFAYEKFQPSRWFPLKKKSLGKLAFPFL